MQTAGTRVFTTASSLFPKLGPRRTTPSSARRFTFVCSPVSRVHTASTLSYLCSCPSQTSVSPLQLKEDGPTTNALDSSRSAPSTTSRHSGVPRPAYVMYDNFRSSRGYCGNLSSPPRPVALIFCTEGTPLGCRPTAAPPCDPGGEPTSPPRADRCHALPATWWPVRGCRR